jgi:cysteine desulfuration protein SufE
VTVDGPNMPAPLAVLAAEFEGLERGARAEMLIEYADQFEEVAPAIASRPFPETNRAPRCESEAFVFVTDRPDGTLDLHFAVENPQGLSAKAWAVILRDTCAGQPLEQVAAAPQDVLFRIFGRDLSMGKGQGLVGMMELVQHAARARIGWKRRHEAGLAD